MEYEVRYYFPSEKLNDIVLKLKNIKELEMHERSYEKTMQFDHPDDTNSFYTKEIDGRFRVRVTKNSSSSKCKLSWKRRINSTTSTDVNKEEEVEVTIKYEEYDNFMFIINNVLKMKDVESYERYRTIFTNEDIEISVDEYPFGIALEIENKSSGKDSEVVVRKWVEVLGLNIKDAYRLSWDDKYSELCRKQGIEHYNHVTFGLPMPKVD
nr:hypothetical protein [Bacilli bacterium]